MIITVKGLPGSGKTSFATALAQELKAAHINSDQVRQSLQLRGKYDEHSKMRVYEAMAEKAKTALSQSSIVVVDATFTQAVYRKLFRNLARHLGENLCWIDITAQEAVIRQRLSKKRVDSEANFKVYQMLKENSDTLLEPQIRIDSTDLKPKEMVFKALSLLSEQML